MKYLRAAIWIAILVIVIYACYGISVGYVQKRAFEDVEMLANAYKTLSISNQSLTMDDLISEINRRGFKLNNPIPLNRHLPCYKVAASSVNLNDAATIIIEETDNVNAKNRVMAFSDGAISVENK